jgi:class 3 adenylate cyclase/tetratricopeptide (TPR) repeat protein
VDIAAWLRDLGLERYLEALRDNEIDATVLLTLTADDLKELGVDAIGHRRKLLNAIAILRDNSVPQGIPTVAADPAGPIGSPRLLPDAERRQVTVLFADLAGYTRLSNELDAEEVHNLLGRFFGLADGIVNRYGGTVDKHIGDCVMAVFGAPVAHGNDPERAIRAALDIRHGMPALGDDLGCPIGVHIGIASGQVVASSTGSGDHLEYTVTGDSVNLASRLTDAAEAGQILISDTIRQALSDRLSCHEVEPLSVKGFAAPIRAWQLHQWRERAGRQQWTFVGRRVELGQLKAASMACRATGCGHSLYIRGEAGIGKTRLIEEFRSVAEAAGFTCHTSLVLDFGTGTGRDAIRLLVRGLLGLTPDAAEKHARAATERASAEGLVEADQRVFLNDLLDLPQPPALRALYDAMDNPSRNRGKSETLACLVERMARKSPLVLVVEDVHWADLLTMQHLRQLTATVGQCPALLVMTSRLEGDPIDRAWRSEIVGPLMTIDLGPLRQEEAETMAGAYIDRSLELTKRCVERAAGNPLFLEQLLRYAEDSASAGIPGSVQNLVQARMDRLQPPDKMALQAASIFGQRFSLEALRFLIERPDYSCTGPAEHFLVRPHVGEFLFAHALIRDGVYESLLRARRRELHRRAAQWFAGRDAVLHAEHLDRAEAPEAARAYFDAARAQAGEHHYERARQLTERGLALAREQADLFALMCFKGGILHNLGSPPEAKSAYEAALRTASDERERCQGWLGLAAVKRLLDDFDGAFADLERAEAAAAKLDLPAELARIHFTRGNLYFPRGEIDRCLEAHQRGLEFARQAGSNELEAAALGGLGDAEYVRGRMISAYKRFDRCVSVCRQHGFAWIEVTHLAMRGICRFYDADLREALQDALTAADAARKLGHHRGEMIGRIIASEMLANLGHLARAKVELECVEELVKRLGMRRFDALRLNCLAKVLRAEGRRREALPLVERSVAIGRETGLSFSGPSSLGALALTTEDPEVREQALIEGEALLQAGTVAHNHFRFCRDAIDTMLNVGDWDRAEHFAAILEDFTRPEPLGWTVFYIARGRALAAYGRGSRDGRTTVEIQRLADRARQTGLQLALPALQRPLGLEQGQGGSVDAHG